ncbi:hypothetical protein FRB95_002957 [Tulasnella sp. JGI-2019a]|nr:hypothetical protein FRB95_002957 [Tulasnella sp. JGI-2019a]
MPYQPAPGDSIFPSQISVAQNHHQLTVMLLVAVAMVDKALVEMVALTVDVTGLPTAATGDVLMADAMEDVLTTDAKEVVLTAHATEDVLTTDVTEDALMADATEDALTTNVEVALMADTTEVNQS